MSVAKCPHCHDEVRIPPVNSTAVVRCPLCQEEYKLAEVLRALPPELIVVEQPGVSGDAMIGSSVVLGRDSQPTGEPAAPFEFNEAEDTAEKQPAAAAPAVVTTSRQRKEKSALGEMAKIVAGGVIGVAIAQLILWWLPSRWARDPFQFGPKASKYAPWIVPKQFHGDSGKSDTAAKSGRNRSGDSGDSSFRLPEDLRKRLNNLPNTDEAKKLRDALAEADKKPVKPAGKKKTPDTPTGSVTLLGVRNAPRYPAEVVRDAWEKARVANSRWTSDKASTERLFIALSVLATRITFADVNDADMSAQAENTRRLLTALSESPKRMASLTNRVPTWFNEVNRRSDGVLLYGKISKIKQSGIYYETRVQIYSSPNSEVTVVSSIDPKKGDLQEGKSAIILGAIVESPEKELIGYEGNQAFVVYGGYPLVVGPPPVALPGSKKKKSPAKGSKGPSAGKKKPRKAKKKQAAPKDKSSRVLIQLPLDGEPPAPKPEQKP